MNKNLIKLAAAATLATMTITLAGCGGDKKETAEVVEDFTFTSYPIQTDVTLEYWTGLNGNVASVAENLGKTRFGEELMKQTGVQVEFIHPAAGQENEQLNVMLASGDLPDIIENNWYVFSGGPTKAIQEEFILPLNDLIESDAPNLKKYLEENPEIDTMIQTDNGEYYVFPFWRNDPLLLINQGLMIRKDWLDECGLEVPTTMDEWHTALTAFKEKKGATAPLTFASAGGYIPSTFANGMFIGAYGITANVYIEDGKVKYGPADPRYKDFLATMAQWYQEGLLDPNIANVDSKLLDANMLTQKSGATFGYGGSTLGKYLSALKAENEVYDLVPAPSPVLNKGETPEFGQYDTPYLGGGSAAITTSSKYPKLAARFLDYGYSEAGYNLNNFGVEGESYNMVDGYPKYTDEVLKNPEGLSANAAMGQYMRSCYQGPFPQAREYVEQYYTYQQQQDALKLWGEHNMAAHKLPMITLTPEENSELSNIKTNVETLVSEKTLRYMTCVEDLDTFDDYIEDLKGFGIDRMIELYQAAYDRYMQR